MQVAYNKHMDALAFLDRPARGQPLPIYVVHGDEDFLKRRVIAALKTLVLGEDEGFGLTTLDGETATFATVRDELTTLPFLGSRRLVLIENADKFVTNYRGALEKYVAEPAATGVLVLDVKSWPANTRLAKMIDTKATLVCKGPAASRLPQWCVQWALAQHCKQLSLPAAELLVELVGAEMGLLDQELAKLAVYVGDAAKIDVNDVDDLVGRSQGANAFKVFDALANGRPGDALAIVDRLFDRGEHEMRILTAFSLQLRRLAQAARLGMNGTPLPAALAQVGVPPFAVRDSEQQLRHIGRKRAERLYDWLVEADIGMKGSSQLTSRMLLERLIARLAQPA